MSLGQLDLEGKEISSSQHTYKIQKLLSSGSNASVYKVKDDNNKAKVFKVYTGRVSCNNGRCKHNHYGRKRDGSKKIFNEIKEKSEKFDFLVQHFERFQLDEYRKTYFMVMEYVEGILLEKYINNPLNSQGNLERAVELLAETLAKWHNHDFAHGDPHLGNAIVRVEYDGSPIEVKLFDYSQIHYPEFEYCKKYKCFECSRRRKDEDLSRPDKKLGSGFLFELKEIDEQSNLNSLLYETFNNSYTAS